ncbi:UBAP1-MVB12-associated (UMA)-domain containing protein 1 isoform X2 [Stigmatopora argus]
MESVWEHQSSALPTDSRLDSGETIEEQRKKMQLVNIGQPSTNVIVSPCKSFPTPIQQREAIFSRDTSLTNMGDGTSTVETALPAPDLLGIPFTLAPQILALPRGFSCIPDLRLSNDIKSMPMYFQYDFSLERASSSMPDTLRAGAGSPPPPTCSAPGKTRSVPVLLRVRPAPRRGKPAFVGDWRYQIQRPRAQQTCYLNTQPDPHEELRKEIPCGSKSTSSEFSDEDYVPSDSEESDEDPTLWRSPKMNSYGKCKRKKTEEQAAKSCEDCGTRMIRLKTFRRRTFDRRTDRRMDVPPNGGFAETGFARSPRPRIVCKSFSTSARGPYTAR